MKKITLMTALLVSTLVPDYGFAQKKELPTYKFNQVPRITTVEDLEAQFSIKADVVHDIAPYLARYKTDEKDAAAAIAKAHQAEGTIITSIFEEANKLQIIYFIYSESSKYAGKKIADVIIAELSLEPTSVAPLKIQLSVQNTRPLGRVYLIKN